MVKHCNSCNFECRSQKQLDHHLQTDRHKFIELLLFKSEENLKEIRSKNDNLILDIQFKNELHVKEIQLEKEICMKEIQSKSELRINEIQSEKEICMKEIQSKNDDLISDIRFKSESCIKEIQSKLSQSEDNLKEIQAKLSNSENNVKKIQDNLTDCQLDNKDYSQRMNNHNAEIEKLRNEIKLIKDSKECFKIISTHESTIEKLQFEIKLLRESNDILKDSNSTLKELRPITVNNNTAVNVNSKITNNVLAFLSPEPIDYEKLTDNILKGLTAEVVYNGDDAVADLILKNLRDDTGKYKIACTDLVRQTFRYTDGDGVLKTDSGLECLLDPLSEATAEKYMKEIQPQLRERSVKFKGGIRVPDIKCFNKLANRAKFKSRKMTGKIAKKTYIKTPKPLADLIFID